MKISRFLIVVVNLIFAAALPAQNLSGTWQGILKEDLKTDKGQRLVLQIKRDGNGGWTMLFYSIDQPDQATDPRRISSFEFHDTNVEFALDMAAGSYEGKLGSDGNTITGTWTQSKTFPLQFVRATKQSAWEVDPTPHTVQFITVEKGVKLEVLDWGGSGRPLILLPGLGDTAHVFDRFALKLIPNYHVYGITTRGTGTSSAPAPITANYNADRLGDDVVAVIEALKLDHPILAGHSIAGEELSSVATRHPEKISAVIYIDAGYQYALYDKAHGDLVLDTLELKGKLDQVHPGTLPKDPKQLDEVLAETRQVEQALQQRKDDFSTISTPHPIDNQYSMAILDGQEKYTLIDLPVLAIFNVPHSPVFLRTMENQARAFETQVPQSQIIRIPQADHYIFQSNEADVLRDMNAFIGGLPANSGAITATHATAAQQ
jgi:non-heme chloroperoxidase